MVVSLSEAQAGDPLADAPRVRVVLRHYLMFSRTPFVDVSSSGVRLHLPSFFGGQRDMTVAMDELAVVDAMVEVAPPDDSPAVYVTPLRLPYLATTTSNVSANVVLLFATPQRLPRLRWGGSMTSGLGRAGRSVDGVLVDGVRLRAQEPRAAIDAIAGAGAARVGDADAWLRTHRETTRDPAAVAEVHSIGRRNRVSYALTVLTLVLLSIGRVMAAHTKAWWPVAVLFALAVVGFSGPILIQRRNRRARHTISANGVQRIPPT
jgi:hypothetical protein